MLQRLILLVALLSALSATTYAQSGVYAPHIVFPNGGETLHGGETVLLRWDGQWLVETDSVRLELTTDDGGTWSTIAKAVGDSMYAWTVPYTASNRCRVRATQIAGVRTAGTRERVYGIDSGIGRLVFSRDGELFLQTAGRHVNIRRTWNGELVRTLQFDGGIPFPPSFSPDGSRVAVAVNTTDNPRGEIWDIASGTKLLTLHASGNPDVPAGIKNEIYSTQYSPDGTRIAMSTRFSLSLWNAVAGTIIDSLPEPQVGLFIYSGNGRYLFTNGGSIAYRDPVTGAPVGGISGGLNFTDISYDGALCTAVRVQQRGNDSLFLVDIDKGTSKAIWTWKNHVGTPFGRFSRDGQRVLVGRPLDSTVIVVDRKTGLEVARFRPNAVGMSAAWMHPDGEHMILQTWPGAEYQLWAFDPFDASDATFTITNPHPVLPAARVRGVKVGDQADTVLGAYVRNTGAEVMTVAEVTIGAGDVGDFQVVDGGGFTLAPGESRDVRVRFRPTAKGERSVWLHVRTLGDTIVGRVSGEGLRGELVTALDLVRFGNVEYKVGRDLWTRTFTNRGTAPLRIDSVYFGGLHRGIYSLVNGRSTPFVIQPGDTETATIRCVPQTIDKYDNGFIVYRDEYGEIHDLLMTCQGVPAAGVEEESGAVAGRSGLVREVSPNPANTWIRVGCNAAEGTEVELTLAELTGEVVLRVGGRVGNGGVVMDLHGVPSGTYVVQARQGIRRGGRVVVVRR